MLPTICRCLCASLVPVLFTSALFAAGDPTECPLNAEGVAPQVKTILGPRYGAADGDHGLADSFREMEILLLQAGHCSAAARSHGNAALDRERNIMEWHSLNQWLERLVGIMRRNTRGDLTASWRDEYSLFAQVYEFEP